MGTTEKNLSLASTHKKTAFIISTGILLLVFVCIVFGKVDKQATQEIADDTFAALERQCTNYDKAVLATEILKDGRADSLRVEMSNLLKGFRIERDGIFLVMQDDRVFWTNNSSFSGKTSESSDFIRKLEELPATGNITNFSYNNKGYLAGKLTYHDYIIYIYFSHFSVFITCRTAMAICLVLYILFWCAYYLSRNRMLQKYQEQLLAEMQKAQHANEAKTEFLRRMSHDIRTPINGIQGMIHMAERFPDDMEKQAFYREKVLVSSNFLLDLVNDVLDMSKLETGEITLENKAFCLTDLLNEINFLLETQATEHGIKYIVEQPEEKLVNVIGSPLHVRQVLLNIGGNAVKYGKSGGYIKVSSQIISSTEDSVTYEFICEDNGIGMSKEFQKHMFEPFMQETNTARTTYQGTGLGLSIVKKLVEKMGGNIEVISEKNIGSTFKICLPFQIDKNATLNVDNSVYKNESLSLEKVHVLLVEDNDINMEISEFILTEAGATVTKAWNGQEAVEQFAQSKPGTYDLILMDIMMPILNGMDATRAIRQMERSDAKTIPIIAMTANAFADDIQRNKDAGMNDHISKPLDETKMLKLIAQYVKS